MGLEEAIDRRHSQSRRLWWLILGRLVAALVLFFARLIWVRGNSQRVSEMIAPLFIVFGLSAAYSLAHRFTSSLLLQARIQVFIDILLVSWLVWNTSVTQSPYIALYIVIIAVASLFVGPRDAMVTSVGCAVAFTCCAIATHLGLGPTNPRLIYWKRDARRQFRRLDFFDVAFLIVGLLSARLAERQSRSDVRLIAANSVPRQLCAPCTKVSWRPSARAWSLLIFRDAFMFSTPRPRR